MTCHRQHFFSLSFKSVSPMNHSFSDFLLCGAFHFDYPNFSQFLFRLNIVAADDLDGGLIYWNWPWKVRKSTGFYKLEEK